MIVVVTRAFLHAGERQEVGRQVDLPDALARQLVAQNKAELYVAPLPEEIGQPAAPAPAADAAPTKRTKKDKA